MNLHRWRWKSIHNNQDQAWIENYWLNADPVEVAALIIPLPNQIVRLLRMKSHRRRRLFVMEDKLLEANLLMDGAVEAWQCYFRCNKRAYFIAFSGIVGECLDGIFFTKKRRPGSILLFRKGWFHLSLLKSS